MLQQTPVARVLPVYRDWLDRWPGPEQLAAATPAEVLRAWGKLGYPRRALRLRECAIAVIERFAGTVPADVLQLQTLPGIGTYTARAIAAFAFGQRVPVVDTNVRRVVARVVHAVAEPGPPSTNRDLRRVERLLPQQPELAVRMSVALMELGALTCTARAPRCPQCPISSRCAWRAAGSPPFAGPRVRAQPFAGSDREVRGRLMDVLRGSDDPVGAGELELAWPDPTQRRRALHTLIVDGLVEHLPDGRFVLPGHC